MKWNWYINIVNGIWYYYDDIQMWPSDSAIIEEIVIFYYWNLKMQMKLKVISK